jgi:prevent-host-death family protein
MSVGFGVFCWLGTTLVRCQLVLGLCQITEKEAEYMSWLNSNMYISKLFLYIIAMKELSVTEAREQFPALLNQAAKKPVWITRHGVDVAVVISPELFETLVEAQEELEDIAAVDEAMLDKSPGIPWEQVQKDLKLI